MSRRGTLRDRRKEKMARTDDGNQGQRANTRAMPPAAISYIPDFVSLTNTGTEQVLTPQFRLQCVIFPETLIGG